MRAPVTCSAAALLGGLMSASLVAAPTPQAAARALTVEDAFKLVEVGAPVLSPDGSVAAYTVSTADLEDDENGSRIWQVALDGGDPIALTTNASSATRPRYSPDGRRLAFLSSRGDDEITQVWALDRRGGEAQRLTEIESGVTDFDWSPDGERLVLVVRDAGPDPEERRPWVVDRLQFKRDYVGYLDRRRMHLWLHEVASGTTRQLTDGDYDDVAPAWSPSGDWIAFVSNRTREPDANYDTDVWLVDPDDDSAKPAIHRVSARRGTDASPFWHPADGRLAFLTTSAPELADYAQNELAIVPVMPRGTRGAAPETGPLTVLTEGLDRIFYDAWWGPAGQRLHLVVEDHGSSGIVAVDPLDGTHETLLDGRVAVASGATAGGREVLTMAEPHRPAEIWRRDSGGAIARLSHHNDALLDEIDLGTVESVEFASPDGAVIQSFVVKPPDFVEGRRYPTLLRIHGGPMGQYDWGFDYQAQLFAANGYLVLRPNPRGSTGRGQAFETAIWQRWGTVDRDDVIAAVDDAIARGWADPEQLGVGGWSYGGILTNYVITTTDRFAAAISGASGALWVASYGHDQYQHWYEVEFGLPWENRELWERLSPYNRVEQIVTPTLWIGGEKDWNVPILHSELMYQAMRRLGRETVLVVYPGEFHGIRSPRHRADLYRRYLDWYGRHVVGEENSTDR